MSATLEFQGGGGTPGAVVGMSGGNLWREDDLYKALVYRSAIDRTVGGVTLTAGTVLGYVAHILDPNFAVIDWHGTLTDTGAWPGATDTLVNPTAADPGHVGIVFALESQAQGDLYASSLYVGEAAQGLTYGHLAWSPLNVQRDPSLWGSAGRAVLVARAGDDLVVCYENAVALFSGEQQASDPPTPLVFAVAEGAGTFRPRACWQDADRRFWFQGVGRMWLLDGTRIVDASRSMGTVRYWQGAGGFFSGSDGSLEGARAAFNATQNATLVVGLSAVPAGQLTPDPEDEGRMGALICHDRDPDTLHPLRLPARMTSVGALPIMEQFTEGVSWFGAAGDVVYRLLWEGAPFPGQDKGFGAETAPVDIAWVVRTGQAFMEERCKPRAWRLSYRTGPGTPSGGFGIAVSMVLRFGNDLGAGALGAPGATALTPPAAIPILEIESGTVGVNGDGEGRTLQVLVYGSGTGGVALSVYSIRVSAQEFPRLTP